MWLRLGDVIQGCPNSVAPFTGARFDGEITDAGLQGEWTHETMVVALPALVKGMVATSVVERAHDTWYFRTGGLRIDQSGLPESVSVAQMFGSQQQLTAIGSTHLPCTAVVEANPIVTSPKFQEIRQLPSDTSHANRAVKESASAASLFVEDIWTDVLNSESKLDVPEQEHKEGVETTTDSEPAFGYVSGKYWLDWCVKNSRTGNMAIGLCTISSNTSDLAGSDASSWGYRANGEVSLVVLS